MKNIYRKFYNFIFEVIKNLLGNSINLEDKMLKLVRIKDFLGINHF